MLRQQPRDWVRISLLSLIDAGISASLMFSLFRAMPGSDDVGLEGNILLSAIAGGMWGGASFFTRMQNYLTFPPPDLERGETDELSNNNHSQHEYR